jgi:hypothetical protein
MDPANEYPDDVDRLFARLERAPVPEDFTARVLFQTVDRARSRAHTKLAWPWLVVGLGALALLGVTGYSLGASLAASDGLDVLGALIGDFGLLLTAPGDVVAALGEVVPWGLVIMAGVSAAFLVWAAGKVVSHAPLRSRHSSG